MLIWKSMQKRKAETASNSILVGVAYKKLLDMVFSVKNNVFAYHNYFKSS